MYIWFWPTLQKRLLTTQNIYCYRLTFFDQDFHNMIQSLSATSIKRCHPNTYHLLFQTILL